MKATTVQAYMLIEEESPFSMLPAPLNLLSIASMPVHFAIIFLKKYSLRDQMNMQEGYANDEVGRVISFAGTLSDIVLRYALFISL